MVINSATAKAKNYYTYSASGVKLKTEQRYDPNLSVMPVETTNPTNDGLADYKNTDYVGNIIYETVKSGSTITNKTRILVDGGYIEDGVYYFYLSDHLGNNRVVANATGTPIQKNHYYPFGTAFAEGTPQEQGKQPYKYNGKQLDDMHQLNLYDYSARYYESALGRFTSVDPLAEKYYSWSPYTYVGNNPIKRTDPTGMAWWTTNDPGEIERVLATLKSGEKIKSLSLGDQWRQVEKVSDDDYAIFDDESLDFTIGGISYKDYQGFGKSDAAFDLFTDLIGEGLEKKGGTFTMFMQQSMGKNRYLRNSYYSISYSSRTMSNKISLSKTRINVSSLGKALGMVTYGYGMYNSINGLATGEMKTEDALFDMGLSTISLKLPILGITYHVVELLHPGGWAGWRKSMDNLSKYADERVMYGPKL